MLPPHTWTVRVAAPARESGGATVFARRHQFAAGDPLSFDQEYNQVTALEYVLGAIGADVVNGLRLAARRKRIEVDEVEAHVEAELGNPLTFLGVVGEEGHPGLARVRVRVFVSSLDPPETLSEAWEEMLERSPLVQTFRPAIDFELSWKVAM